MRYIYDHLIEDLQRKMVFVGGPRQVGKTTLARAVIDRFGAPARYFNWDSDEDRRAILQKAWRSDDRLLVFDELHKYPRWKNWIKGLYDVSGERHAILVTGSARLDIYRRGGDSLMGRYHYWRLHPFTLDELPPGVSREDGFRRLMVRGGFPEPFLSADERLSRRWRRERFDRVLREDVRDLEAIRLVQLLVLFIDLLRERVGSPVTLAGLARGVQVSPKTAAAWLAVAERMYLLFVVRPLVRSLPRAVLKPPKVYFFDNADVIGNEGARFENLVAASLLKRIHFMEDREGFRMELRYIRDKEGREVDFAIIKEGRLDELVEVKWSDDTLSNALRYYTQRLKPARATQIVAHLRHPYDRDGIRVTTPLDYFAGDFA